CRRSRASHSLRRWREECRNRFPGSVPFRWLLFGSDGGGRRLEIFREMRQRAHHRIGSEAAERAERAELHRVAEIRDQLDLPVRGNARRKTVEHLDTARRADAAWRALAAALDSAELHGEAGLLQHVGGVVKDDDPGMA